MGNRLRDVYPYASRFQVFKFRAVKILGRVVVASAIAGSVFGAYLLGGVMNPVLSYVDREVRVPVETMAPVLDRIAKAESHGSHYCTDDLIRTSMCKASSKGQVLLHANVKGSVDIGKYQINNEAWGAQATKLGLNLFDPADNEKMARWIYSNYGTEPWYSSKANW